MNEVTEAQIQAWKDVLAAFDAAAKQYKNGRIPEGALRTVSEALKKHKTALNGNRHLVQHVAEQSNQSLMPQKNSQAYPALFTELKNKYKDLNIWIERTYNVATAASQKKHTQAIHIVEEVDPVQAFLNDLPKQNFLNIRMFLAQYPRATGKLNAAFEAQPEILEKLFQENSSLDSIEIMLGWKSAFIDDAVKQSPDLHTVFFQACQEGRPELVANLLALDPSMVNAVNENGLTPLMLAKNAIVAGVLVDNGADPKIVGPDGMTPFLYACKAGDPELASFFIQRGASLNEVDAQGRTGLMYASSFDQKNVMMYLLGNRGARDDIVDKNGYSALTHACIEGHYELAEMLLDYRSKLVNSALPIKVNVGDVASQGFVHLVGFLVDHGAKIKRDDLFHVVQAYDSSTGNEPAYTEIVRILLKNGAKLSNDMKEYIDASSRHTGIDIMLREKRLLDILEKNPDPFKEKSRYNKILENMTSKEISDFVIKYPQHEAAFLNSYVLQEREQKEIEANRAPKEDYGILLFNQLIMISSVPSVENLLKDKTVRDYLENNPALVLALLLEGNKDLNKAFIAANLNFDLDEKGKKIEYCLEMMEPTADAIEAKAIWESDESRHALSRLNIGNSFSKGILAAIILGSSPDARHELKEALGAARVGEMQEYFKLADSRAMASSDLVDDVQRGLEFDDKIESILKNPALAAELLESKSFRQELDNNPRVLTKLFFEACSKGHSQTVNAVLQHYPAFLDQRSPNNLTPLEIACQKGHVNLVKVLLQHDANFNKNNFILAAKSPAPLRVRQKIAELLSKKRELLRERHIKDDTVDRTLLAQQTQNLLNSLKSVADPHDAIREHFYNTEKQHRAFVISFMIRHGGENVLRDIKNNQMEYFPLNKKNPGQHIEVSRLLDKQISLYDELREDLPVISEEDKQSVEEAEAKELKEAWELFIQEADACVNNETDTDDTFNDSATLLKAVMDSQGISPSAENFPPSLRSNPDAYDLLIERATEESEAADNDADREWWSFMAEALLVASEPSEPDEVAEYLEEIREQREERQPDQTCMVALDKIRDPDLKKIIKKTYDTFARSLSTKDMPSAQTLQEWVEWVNNPKMTFNAYMEKLDKTESPVLTALFSMTKDDYNANQKQLAVLQESQAPKAVTPKDTILKGGYSPGGKMM